MKTGQNGHEQLLIYGYPFPQTKVGASHCLVYGLETQTPRPKGEWHAHEALEIGVVLRGQEVLEYDGCIQVCDPGIPWLSSIWEPHSWRVSKPGTETTCIVFLPGLLTNNDAAGGDWTELFALPPSMRPQLRDSYARKRAIEIGWTIRREAHQKEFGWHRMVQLGVMELLLLLKRALPLELVKPNTRDNPDHLSRLSPALMRLSQRPAERLTVSEAAALCAMSESHFRHLFTDTIGVSFAKFALRARLSYCAQQLVMTDSPLSAIATRVGFVDASHFHRAFFRQYRCTPHDFRLRQRHSLSAYMAGPESFSDEHDQTEDSM